MRFNQKNSILLSLIFVYFILLIAYLFIRENIDALPVWWTTISKTKLIYLSALSFVFASIFIWLSRSRLLNVLIMGLLLLIPYLSYSDMYVYKAYLGFFSESNHDIIVSRNNPLLGETERIRSIKQSSHSSTELWRSLQIKYMSNDAYASASDTERAMQAMLLVSALFDYGNKIPKHKQLTGCVSNSEETDFRDVQVTYTRFKTAQVGCCTDYAYALSSFLTFLGFQNEFVLMQGHIANRVRIEGSWYFLDSTTNVFVKGMFDERPTKLEFEYFPSQNISRDSERYVVYSFQNYLIRTLHERSRYFWRSIETQKASDGPGFE